MKTEVVNMHGGNGNSRTSRTTGLLLANCFVSIHFKFPNEDQQHLYYIRTTTYQS